MLTNTHKKQDARLQTGDASLPLHVHNSTAAALKQVPLTTGVCFAKSQWTPRPTDNWEGTASESSFPCAVDPMVYWADGSVRWATLYAVIPEVFPGSNELSVSQTFNTAPNPKNISLLRTTEQGFEIQLPQRPKILIDLTLHDANSRSVELIFDVPLTRLQNEVCSLWESTARAKHIDDISILIEALAFTQSGHLRCNVTLRNSRAAHHKGGLWDLGDPAALRFRSFEVLLRTNKSKHTAQVQPHAVSALTYVDESSHQGSANPIIERSVRRRVGQFVQVFQGSSGGDNELSLIHMNSDGKVPLRLRGTSIQIDDTRETGRRIQPTVHSVLDAHLLSVSVPEFWQQFPKSIKAGGGEVTVGLFPPEFGELHELQPGEQKTHTVWAYADTNKQHQLQFFDIFSTPSPALQVRQPADWVARSNALQQECENEVIHERLEVPDVAARALSRLFINDRSVSARREAIDEFGWRNYGELWADHEAANYAGSTPIVSHYNNQFDVVSGGLLNWLRTGESHWFDLFEPLSRHVVDIDCYHTQNDRAAYSGGLFWHTDHFCHAQLSTHRTYSKLNAKQQKNYGGGPSCEHNYTTGLLQSYLISGNAAARQAVIDLANWVIRMDDGRQSWLSVLVDAPTGLASRTKDENYHGPGRGAGNSLNALLDAWWLTGDELYWKSAEALVHRVIPPNVSIDEWDLLNAEYRWSYVMFVVAWDKFLEFKLNRASEDPLLFDQLEQIRALARWMAVREKPWLDHPDQLDYPNETWAAQDLRKANALRLAARYLPEKNEREQLLQLGNTWADLAWSRWEEFSQRYNARCAAIIMTAGLLDAWLRTDRPAIVPDSPRREVRPRKTFALPFASQKSQILSAKRSPLRAARMLANLVNPFRWMRYRSRRRANTLRPLEHGLVLKEST